jgi:hypothetical protein
MDETRALWAIGNLRDGLERVMWQVTREAESFPQDAPLRLRLIAIADDARKALDSARTAQWGVSLLSQPDQKSVVNQ